MMGMLKQQKLSLEAHKAEMTSTMEKQGGAKIPKPLLQKLSPEDDIKHLLAVLERVAQQQKWQEAIWTTQLVGLLTGKAMAVFAALEGTDANDYKKVCDTILQRYDINEESRCGKFGNDQERRGETHREFMTRLQEYFQRWIKGQEMGLEDLMIAEQFYQSLPDGLAVWLKDRKPASLKYMAELADDYMLSRKGTSTVQQADKSTKDQLAG